MPEPADDVARWLAQARAGSQEALGQALEACRGYLLLVARREMGADLQAKGGESDLVRSMPTWSTPGRPCAPLNYRSPLWPSPIRAAMMCAGSTILQLCSSTCAIFLPVRS